MTVREFYSAIGADYDSRLGKEDRILRFLMKFPEDGNYGLLCRSIEEGNREEAFRAAHTIKGICQNLSLQSLYEPVSRLSDYLKSREYDDDAALLLEQVTKEYLTVTAYIRQL